MKNLKIILAVAVVILALSACQKATVPQPEEEGPPLLPPAVESPNSGRPNIDIGALCVAAKGTWSAEWLECGGVDQTWCEANGGVFEECGSACRHNPKAEMCTLQCVIFCRFGSEAPRPEAQVPPASQEPLIGGDRDAHGCIGSAGYSWCENKQKCMRLWEEACWPEVAEAIQQAFVVKYKKPIEQIQVTVNQLEGGYAKGGVKFAMKGQFGEGGIFFAAKVDGKWSIVFDGNGLTTCDIFKPYDFPASMVEGVCLK